MTVLKTFNEKISFLIAPNDGHVICDEIDRSWPLKAHFGGALNSKN